MHDILSFDTTYDMECKIDKCGVFVVLASSC